MKLGTRVWGLITVVVVAALVAGGYFLGVSPLLSQRASAETARQAALAQNQGLQNEIARLEAARGNLDEYQALAASYEQLVPDTVDSQRFIRSLDSLAGANGVTIQEISIQQFLPYVPPENSDEYSEDAPPPFTDGRITGDNFVIVPFSITVTGGWAESLNFVHQLQFGDRLVLLTTIDQSVSDGTYSTTVAAYMYVLVKPGTPVPGQEPVEEGAEQPASTDDPTASAEG